MTDRPHPARLMMCLLRGHRCRVWGQIVDLRVEVRS